MGTSLETLQRFVRAGQAAQSAVDRVIARQVVDVDREILNRLPITTAATYRYGDAWDAMMARSRLRTCGSIVESVCLEISAEQLRERAGR